MTFGPSQLSLWPTDAIKASADFTTPEGYDVRILYSVNSQSLLNLQLSNLEIRTKALQSLVNISANRQILLSYLSSSTLVKLFISTYRKSLKTPSVDGELVASLWSFIAGELRLTMKTLETCPDLVDQFWQIIEKDKDKHARGYFTIFSIFKQLSGLAGGSALLPKVVATFERSVRNLGTGSYELFIQIIPLMTYFDPKYAQYYASHSNTIELLGRAFKTALELKFPPVVFDQIFSLVRFLGLPYASSMKDVGVFDMISELTRSSDQPRIQINAIQISELFGIELHDQSMESLIESLRSAEAPLERVKAMNMLEQLLKRAPPPDSVRSSLATALMSSTTSTIADLSNQSIMLLGALQLSTDECIKFGLIQLYHSALIKALEAPFMLFVDNLSCIFEILLDSIRRTGMESTTIAFDRPPAAPKCSQRPSSMTKGCISSLLLTEVEEAGLYDTLSTPVSNWSPWFVLHLSFWTSAHHGLPSLSPCVQEFYAKLLKRLSELTDPGHSGPYLLDIAYPLCFRLLANAALSLGEEATDADRALNELHRSTRKCLKHLKVNQRSMHLSLRVYLPDFAPPPERALEERLKQLTDSPVIDDTSPDSSSYAESNHYSFGLFSAITHFMQPSTANFELTDLICRTFYNRGLFKSSVSSELFVYTIFLLLHSFYDKDSCCALIGEFIKRAPSLRQPHTTPLFYLIDGAMRFLTHFDDWETTVPTLMTKSEMERLVLFESAIVMQVIKIDSVCPFTASKNTPTWSLRGISRPLRVNPEELLSDIFARHANFLGLLSKIWPLDFYNPLPEPLTELCDTPWWCESELIDYLISATDIILPGMLMLRIELFKHTTFVRARIAELKATNEPTQSDSASESPDAPTALTPFELALSRALANPMSILSSMKNVLEEIFLSLEAPSLDHLSSLADLCRMWKLSPEDCNSGSSPTNAANNQPKCPFDVLQSDTYWFYQKRLSFLFYLLRVLDYLHHYDEFYAILRSSDNDYSVLNDPLFGLLNMTSFLPRFLFVRRANVCRNRLPWRSYCNQWLPVELAIDYALGLSHTTVRPFALDHWGTENRASQMPKFDRVKRLELVSLLMNITMDVINFLPKDHVAPLCSPTEHANGVTTATSLLPPLNPTNNDVIQLARVQAMLLVFAAETIGSIATYPAPSISRPAIQWLSSRFWRDLPTHADYQCVISSLHGLQPGLNSEFVAMMGALGRSELWIPETFGQMLFVHFHDPETVAMTLRGLSHLWDRAAYSLRPHAHPYGSPTARITYETGDKLPHAIQSLLMHYLHRFEQLINNPAEWELKHVLSVPPEPSVAKSQHSILSLPSTRSAFHLNTTNGFKLPERPTSKESPLVKPTDDTGAIDGNFEGYYNETLEWTDWDELEWFTRPPIPTEPTLRIYPLDAHSAYHRQPEYVRVGQKWDSHHPFPYIIDPKSIPKDDATRLSTIKDRLPTYISALGDVIVAALELLSIDAKGKQVTPNYSDGHPQLPWCHERIPPTEKSVESAYILLSQIICRKEVENRSKLFSGIIPPNVGYPCSASSHFTDSFLVFVRSDLEESLLKLPELRDFAWKLLAIPNTPFGSSPAVNMLNELVLQKMIELELDEPSATSRLSPTHPLWHSVVIPALRYNGSIVIQRLPPKLQLRPREAMLTAAKSVIKEIIHDAAACINLAENVELTPYVEFVDFSVAHLRLEDHSRLPRIHEERVYGGAPSAELNRAQTSLQVWIASYRKDIFYRLQERLQLLLELTRGIHDFPWDDLLHTPESVPCLSEEERAAGLLRFKSVAPRPAAYYKGPPEVHIPMTDAERGTYPMPQEFRTEDDQYIPPDFHTAKSLDFKLKSSNPALTNWRHVIEAPSVLRLVAACELIYLSDVTLQSHDEREMRTSFCATSQAILTQAVSTPLQALRFATDPYYVHYLQYLSMYRCDGALEMRVGALITRTGLLEPLGLLNIDGAPITPKDDMIDEKHGTIVLGRKNKKSIRKGLYLVALRNAFNGGFRTLSNALSVACAIPAYTTLMTHDPRTWNFQSGSRYMYNACSVLYAIHLDMSPSDRVWQDIHHAVSRTLIRDELTASLWGLRWKIFNTENSRSKLPQEILLPSGDDLSFDESGCTQIPAINAGTASSSSQHNETVKVASLGSLMAFVESTVPDGWKLPNQLPVLPELRPISHLPTLYAIPPNFGQTSKRRVAKQSVESSIIPPDMVTPPTCIALTHFGMIKESDHETQDDSWFLKKATSLGVSSIRVAYYTKLYIPKFTVNTRPYFLTNGLTGACFVTQQEFSTLHTTEPFNDFVYADATEPGKISDTLVYWAIPHNRIMSVWFPQFARSFGPSTADPSNSVTRFRLSRLQANSFMAFRLGFATASALEKINAHPLLAVGDVPGSFAFSFQETGTFEQGKYRPLLGPNGWWRMRCSNLHRRDVFVDVDTHFKTIQFHGDLHPDEQHFFQHNIILPDDFDTSEELFPVLSFYSVSSFHFDVFSPATAK